MDNAELVAKFNPNNATSLTSSDFEKMRALTDEEINVLAEHYPNQPQRRAYLRLYDQKLPPHKQLYALSTWQNLRNLRKFAGKKNLIAWDYVANVSKVVQRPPVKGTQPAKKVVVDMSAQDAAAELKNAIKNTTVKPVNSPRKTTAQEIKGKLVSKLGEVKPPKAKKPAAAKATIPPDQEITDGAD